MRTIGSGRFKANEWSSTSNTAPLAPRLPRDPPPRTRCAGEASVAAGLEGYYELAARKRSGRRSCGNTAGRRQRSQRSQCGLSAMTGPAKGLRRIGEREVDRIDTADCDDRWFILAVDHAVVLRSSGTRCTKRPAGAGTREAGSKSAPPLTAETTTQNRSLL
jgi:hypothetical protein